MPTDLETLVTSFLLALGFVCSVLVFLPIPGLQQLAAPIKAGLALSVTCCLLPSWLPPEGTKIQFSSVIMPAMARDCVLGVATGLLVALLTEALTFMAQQAATQAGFNYASTLDPTNQVDTGTLQVVASLLAGLLFFSLGLDHRFLIALSLYVKTQRAADPAQFLPAVTTALRAAFLTSVQLSLPVTALLLLVDLSLAFAGRMQAHLQLLQLTMPLKVLACFLILSVIFRNVVAGYERLALTVLHGLTQAAR